MTDEAVDWDAEYAFLLDELIKQAQTINYLVERLLKLEVDLKNLISIEKTTLNSIKFAVPHIKEMVESYDGITGYLSTNVSKRLNELESFRDRLKKPKPKSKYS